jgi:hypothetical protein
MMTILTVIAVLLFIDCVAAVLSVYVVQRCESDGVFRLGTVQDPPRGPGLARFIHAVDRMTQVNRQIMTVSVPAQDCITKDNVSVRVDAVVYFRVVDAVEAAVHGQHPQLVISEAAQTSLRSVIGEAELDDLLSNRKKFGAELTQIIDAPSEKPRQVMSHKPAHTPAQGPVGPQEAPPWGPPEAAPGPRDAAGVPQDAVQGAGKLELLDAKAHHAFGLNNLSSERSSKPSTIARRVVADLAPTIATAKMGGATKALRTFAAGRRVPFVRIDRDDGSCMPAVDLLGERAAATERTILDRLPRPLGGPAYLGSRDDAGYLRGWDDAVDWIRQGNQARPPSWGSAAYMTGWNDALRAIVKARPD